MHFFIKIYRNLSSMNVLSYLNNHQIISYLRYIHLNPSSLPKIYNQQKSHFSINVKEVNKRNNFKGNYRQKEE